MSEKPTQDPKTGRFLTGGSGGKRKGARNRLHGDFVAALQEHFTEIGNAAIDIVFKESPRDYLKIIVAVLPKEFIIEDGRLKGMSDEELHERLERIEQLERRLAETPRDEGRDTSGNKPSLN
jgi:hypothetical protein